MPKNNKKKVIRARSKKPAAPVFENIRGEVVLCTDIEKLTFDKFLKCIIDNKYSALIISGIPTPVQLFYAWITVLSEYYKLIKSTEQLRHIKLIAKMEALNLKINIVSKLCEGLKMWYDERIIKCLKLWGYKMQYGPDTVLKDIERTLLELSNDNFKLIKLKQEYEAVEKQKRKGGKAPGKEHYMKILYAIEKHRAPTRYPVDKLTVFEYGMFYNELVDYNNMMREQNEKLTDKTRKRNGK